jgi:hypothetical protein
MPTASKHLLEDKNVEMVKEALHTLYRHSYKMETSMETPFPDKELPPLPPPDTILTMKKKQQSKAAYSALGILVLAMKRQVGSMEDKIVNLRLDSGVDITLILAEFYHSLKYPPKAQQGLWMKLQELTSTDSALEGFVRIPILVEDNTGCTLVSEAEAYIIPGMTVPILLGEDYQIAYEINITWNIEKGIEITYRKTNYTVTTQPVRWTDNFNCLEKSTFMTAHFVQGKMHQCRKANIHQRRKAAHTKSLIVRAAKDYRIWPHECHPIKVTRELGERKEWSVEKNLVQCQSSLLITNFGSKQTKTELF